ncbi:hypothetical protein [Proteus faecis]|uniref:Uncharacterized protein n=1 Tax=Proteus faecis TaxID=2050967 RepID=A0AAW7CNW5_9GAMM|nr:hypothetical protein [Proteus faecis]MBG3013259.1 hypothetical protein [Proteus mirabilis]MDL5165651.1 hypothetical protein [Proteus faecis]MDL5274085.1 hypothetical protein [Proteus faecis]MDL5277655.1 hypothetical protein [Proteus faecis]MDL5306645.1 hypothetical protein [Proteus faecis]
MSIEGGRQSPPPLTGFYYPTIQLPNVQNSWSLVIEIYEGPKKVADVFIQFK